MPTATKGSEGNGAGGQDDAQQTRCSRACGAAVAVAVAVARQRPQPR